MSRRAPEHAMRRLIADLAAMHPDDLAAILSAFGPAERQQIETLLRQYNPIDVLSSRPEPDRSGIDEEQLSRWLVDRLQLNSRAAMTPYARQALRECAKKLYPAPAEQSATTRRTRLFKRVLSNEDRAS